MKFQYTLLFALLLGSFSAQAQAWGEGNPVWHYYDSDYSTQGYMTVMAVGDTTIQGRDAIIFGKQYEVYYRSGNTINRGDYPPDVMYEEEEVVYLWNAGVLEFDTLMNFMALPGENWSIAAGDSLYMHTVHRRVIDTLRFTVLNEERKALIVLDSSDIFGTAFQHDTLVRGIGPIRGYYRPWGRFEQWVDGSTEGDEFRCFQNDEIGLFKKSSVACDYIQTPFLFASEESRWIYNTGAPGFVEVVTDGPYETEGSDIVIDLLFNYTFQDPRGGTVSFEGEHGAKIPYNYGELSVVLFEVDSTSVDTLYNFIAVIGDIWHIDLPGFKDAVRCEVIDEGSMLIDGFRAKTWTVEYSADYIGFPVKYTDIVVEGLGNLREFILPWDYFEGQLDGQRGGTLRCFKNEEVSYQRPNIEECIPLTLPAKSFSLEEIKICPNPVGSLLHLPDQFEAGRSFRIFSLTGQVMQGMVGSGKVDVNGLLPGIYFLTVQEKGKKQGVARFIKR